MIHNEDLTNAVMNTINEQMAGSFVEGFVGIINYIDSDGDRRFFMLWPDEQFFDRSLSMADHLHRYLREVQRLNINASIIDIDDEDDD